MLARALSAALAVITAAGPALAGQVELVWLAPEHHDCPPVEEVQQRVERILNRPMASGAEALLVRALVTPPDEQQPWSVVLETANGSRRLEAASCDELANVTAVFVAIMIEPSIDEPKPAEAPAPPPPPPARGVAPSLDRDSAAPVHAPPSTSWALGAVAGGTQGLLPEWSLGFGAHGAFSWKSVRSSVGVLAWLPVERTLDDSPEQGARFELYSAHAELCLHYAEWAIAPALCSGGALSLLRGEGFGPGVAPEARSAVLGSLTVGGALFVRQSPRLAFLLDVDAVFPLGDRQFVFAGSDPALVHEPAPGIRLTCGAEWVL